MDFHDHDQRGILIMADEADGANGWNECKRDIFHRFDVQLTQTNDLKSKIETMQTQLTQLTISFNVFEKEMRIKSGLFGFLAGCVPIFLTILVYLVQHLVTK